MGTVQLGTPYGIANISGKPNQKTAFSILSKAWDSGIREFDTAQGYGDSEKVLGRSFSELGVANKVEIISKFHPDLNHLDRKQMEHALEKSLDSLGVSRLFAIMLHREEFLSYWDQGLKDILETFKANGKVKYTGVSVYTPEKAILALETDGIELVQLPTSILDRRFFNTGVFDLASRNKKTIYIRSIFLQGLVLMNLDSVPNNLSFAKPVIKSLDNLCFELGLTRNELALAYLKANFPKAKILFGAETPDQVEANVKTWRDLAVNIPVEKIEAVLGKIDEKVLNPSLW